MPFADANKRRETQREYQSRYYRKHPEYYKEKARDRRQALYAWTDDIKRSLGCSRCPEKEPVALDFHHRDPATKLGEVSKMITRGLGRKTIEAEIAKCDVLCSNCHRKETHSCRVGEKATRGPHKAQSGGATPPPATKRVHSQLETAAP